MPTTPSYRNERWFAARTERDRPALISEDKKSHKTESVRFHSTPFMFVTACLNDMLLDDPELVGKEQNGEDFTFEQHYHAIRRGAVSNVFEVHQTNDDGTNGSRTKLSLGPSCYGAILPSDLEQRTLRYEHGNGVILFKTSLVIPPMIWPVGYRKYPSPKWRTTHPWALAIQYDPRS